MLASSSPARVERVLRIAIATAVASVPVSACSSPYPCGGGFTSQTYDVTFTVCAADGGTGDAGDAGACFTTCDEACSTLKPASDNGFGECVNPDGATAAPGTTMTASCQTALNCTGRKLDGIAAPHVDGEPLGAWLARAAWLEASAVHAFRRLARELRAHGAPERLVSAARAAARDEIRHARIMSALARKHGAVVPRIVTTALPVRDLESIARENAVEGCVSETYGAAIAAWQASHSNDADVAHAMSMIAPDELRHAALGWAVHAWAERRLPRDARERVRHARDEAARALLDEARATREESSLAEAIASLLWAA